MHLCYPKLAKKRWTANIGLRLLRVFLVMLLSMSAVWPGRVSAAGKGRMDDIVAVRRVMDGDTVSAFVGGRYERIRLIGIDAPEIGQIPWGPIARERLRQMIAASSWKVGIEFDVGKRDKYGRLLAYLRTGDGRMVNREMIREGYAVLFTVPPNVKYAEEFVAAERYARKRKIGIWSANGLKEKPADYRREHPRFR